MNRVLFVCHGNTCRSPMAVALSEKMFGPSVKFESAGLETGEGLGAAITAQQVMAAMGLDISKHRTRSVDSIDLCEYDVLVGLTGSISTELKELFPELSERVFAIEVADPYGGNLERYRQCVVDLEKELSRVRGILS